ncbi:hypothetical protein D3C75_766430 [compost metagenome]
MIFYIQVQLGRYTRIQPACLQSRLHLDREFRRDAHPEFSPFAIDGPCAHNYRMGLLVVLLFQDRVQLKFSLYHYCFSRSNRL